MLLALVLLIVAILSDQALQGAGATKPKLAKPAPMYCTSGREPPFIGVRWSIG
jgi:hypothetical protein